MSEILAGLPPIDRVRLGDRVLVACGEYQPGQADWLAFLLRDTGIDGREFTTATDAAEVLYAALRARGMLDSAVALNWCAEGEAWTPASANELGAWLRTLEDARDILLRNVLASAGCSVIANVFGAEVAE